MRLYELLTEKDPEDRRTLPKGFKYDDAGNMVIDTPEYVKQMKILKYCYFDQIQLYEIP